MGGGLTDTYLDFQRGLSFFLSGILAKTQLAVKPADGRRSDRPGAVRPARGGQTGHGGGLTGFNLFRWPAGGDDCVLGQVHGFQCICVA